MAFCSGYFPIISRQFGPVRPASAFPPGKTIERIPFRLALAAPVFDCLDNTSRENVKSKQTQPSLRIVTIGVGPMVDDRHLIIPLHGQTFND